MDDRAIISRLAFEANDVHLSVAYNKGILLSVATTLRTYLRGLTAPPTTFPAPSLAHAPADVAFSVFKNERSTVEEHKARTGLQWQHVNIELASCSGLPFASIVASAPWRLPVFLYLLVDQFGWRSLRTFAYPFLGYLIYKYLRRAFRKVHRATRVVTVNMSHPISLAVQYAATDAQLQTIFLEHAPTPRLIARDHGYTEVYVRSPHTKVLLARAGISAERVRLIDYWQQATLDLPMPIGNVRRVGIAVNDWDEFDNTAELSRELLRRGIECQIRVHDADRRLNAFRQLGRELAIEISSAAAGNIVDFVKHQDVVVVGNSSVLLDCFRARVAAIYLWPGPAELFDYYGLVDHMKCPSARSNEELLDLIPACTAAQPVTDLQQRPGVPKPCTRARRS